MKTYQCPKVELFEFETESFLTTSLKVNQQETTAPALSNKKSPWNCSNWSNAEKDYHKVSILKPHIFFLIIVTAAITSLMVIAAVVTTYPSKKITALSD